MSAVLRYDQEITAGFPLVATFTFLRDDDVVADFADWTAILQVRRNPYTSDDPVIDKVLALDGTTGDVSMVITEEESAGLAWGYYVYGITLLNASDDPEVFLVEGNITVYPDPYVVAVSGASGP